MKQDLFDLGFGAVVASESRRRLINTDGSFNVVKRGASLTDRLGLHHALLTMSWPRFVVTLGLLYLTLNALFACLYFLCGPGAFEGTAGASNVERFSKAFFFSVHTLSTIGYGYIKPVEPAAELVAVLESFAGLFVLALSAGLVFARFSRPVARILYSKQAVVAPFGDGTAFEFRVANRTRNQLIQVGARVIFSQFEIRDGQVGRRFHELSLERPSVVFFPLTWTIVHPIDETSPLWGKTQEDLLGSDAEFLVLLSAVEEGFSQSVYSRTSYKADEVQWNRRFERIFYRAGEDGPLSIDLERIHETTSD